MDIKTIALKFQRGTHYYIKVRLDTGLCQDGFQCPSPLFFGLMKTWTGSFTPRPLAPSPVPGFHPMFCNIWLPTLLSGIGAAEPPTLPKRFEMRNVSGNSIN